MSDQSEMHTKVMVSVDPDKGSLTMVIERIPTGEDAAPLGMVAAYDGLGLWAQNNFEGVPPGLNFHSIVESIRKHYSMTSNYAQYGGEDPHPGGKVQ